MNKEDITQDTNPSLSEEQEALYADWIKNRDRQLREDTSSLPLWLRELYDSFRLYHPSGDRRKSPPDLEDEDDLPF